MAAQSPASELRRVIATLDTEREVGGEALSLLHHLQTLGVVPAAVQDDVARAVRQGIALELFHPGVEDVPDEQWEPLWCSRCQEEVPGVMTEHGLSTGCCGRSVPVDWRERQAATEVPC